MSVHRLRKYNTEDPFTRVPNAAVNDPNLDLKARGLLLLMLSKPDGWTFRERNLAQSAGVGRDQLRAAMKTLIDAGYVVRTREAEDGKPPVVVTSVYDSPAVGNPEVGKPDRRETRPISNELGLVTNDSIAAAPRETVKPKAPRPADPLWDAMIAACRIDPTTLTGSERGRINKALKELREVGATPTDIERRATAYRKKYPDAAITPTALTGNWSQLTTTTARRDVCPDCSQPLTGHVDEFCIIIQQGGI